MVEKQLEQLSLNQITREKLTGHKKQVNSINAYASSQSFCECLLSASDDGTARLWDLRTNKGTMLL